MPSLNGISDASVSHSPSPQPTHITQKILKEDATGYIAPEFEGKAKQMELGL
jgi:glutamate dehydrogenase